MKEKKTLPGMLWGSIKKSATKIDPRAKKSAGAMLKARGMSKKKIRAALKKRSAAAKAAAAPAPEEKDGTVRNLAKLASFTRDAVRAGSRIQAAPRKKS